MGAIEADKVTKRQIRAWLDLAERAPALGTGKFATSQATRDFSRDDNEEVRRKPIDREPDFDGPEAALGHAFNEGHIAGATMVAKSTIPRG